MAVEFKLPDIGEGISEAVLLLWHVEIGEEVSEGQAVADISTDKVDVELPAPASGVVLERRCDPGDVVAVGSVILVIGAAGETSPPDGGDGKRESSSEPPPAAAAPAVENAPRQAAPPPPSRVEARAGRVVASPLARRVAAEHGLDVEQLVGTGPHGRIRRKDIERALAVASEESSGVRREPLDRVRAVMAERMAAATRTPATSTTTFVAEATRLGELVDRLRPDAAELDLKLTPLTLIAACAAATLRRHPRFNATVDEGSGDLLLHDRVNLGIAAATERGLVVPVVDGADRLSLFALAGRIQDLATRAREGRLEPVEVRGGTFTVSSTGALERASILSTQPIINPPQTATIWCSRIEQRPWVVDGELVALPLLTCSLSFDHRYVDGAEATAFINDFTGFVERPDRALAGAAGVETDQMVG